MLPQDGAHEKSAVFLMGLAAVTPGRLPGRRLAQRFRWGAPVSLMGLQWDSGRLAVKAASETLARRYSATARKQYRFKLNR